MLQSLPGTASYIKRLLSNSSAQSLVTRSNEWVEGTQIEPIVSYGGLYLDITRQYAAQFKSGAPVAAPAAAPARPIAPATAAPPPTKAPTATPTPVLLQPDQGLTTDIVRVRSGPGTFYSVLGRLRASRVVNLLARTADNEWLQIAYPDADHSGWLSSDFIKAGDGLYDLPVYDLPVDAWLKNLDDPALFPGGDLLAQEQHPVTCWLNGLLPSDSADACAEP